MTKLLAIEVDAQTGLVSEREFTAEDVSAQKSIQEEFEAVKSAIDARTEARASGLAKLAALGLTEEEIAAL